MDRPPPRGWQPPDRPRVLHNPFLTNTRAGPKVKKYQLLVLDAQHKMSDASDLFEQAAKCTCPEEAQEKYQRGLERHRESADLYKQAMLEPPNNSKRFSMRWICFENYLDFLRDFDYALMSDEDADFLWNQVWKNKHELVCYRVEAFLFWMMWKLDTKGINVEPDKHADWYYEALGLVKKSPKEHEDIVLRNQYDSRGILLYTDELEKQKQKLQMNLKQLQGKRLAQKELDALKEKEASSVSWISICKYRNEVLLSRALAGGAQCDCCGKVAKEKKKALMQCKRCRMSFYCSKNCQEVHWHEKGHRKACRKEGQIITGDDMRLNGLDRVPHQVCKTLDNCFVKVVERDADDNQRWVVDCDDTGAAFKARLTVDKKYLHRLRPPPTVGPYAMATA